MTMPLPPLPKDDNTLSYHWKTYFIKLHLVIAELLARVEELESE